MTSVKEVLQEKSNKMDLNEKSRIRKFLGVKLDSDGKLTDTFGKQTIDHLRGQATTGEAKGLSKLWTGFLDKIPGKLKGPLASGLDKFTQLPGIKNLSGFVKGQILFSSLFGAFSVANDTAKGYQQTQGDPVSRFIGGLTGGINSLIKNTGVIAASVGGALLPKVLFGLSPLGSLGIVAGTVGSIVTGGIAGKIIGKFIKTPSDLQKEQQAMQLQQAGGQAFGATQGYQPDAVLSQLTGQAPGMQQPQAATPMVNPSNPTMPNPQMASFDQSWNQWRQDINSGNNPWMTQEMQNPI